MNFWQGKKVRLRAIEPADATFFFDWNQDSQRAQNLDFLWPPTSLAAVIEWTRQESLKRLENGAYHWVIENFAGQPVGSIDTHHCDLHAGTFSYGVDITEAHQRQGYASEAISLVLRYYFDELRYQKVTVPVHSNNIPSLRLHEGLGFLHEGVHRRMGYSGGQYYDVVWFGMTVEEFRARNNG